MAVKSIVDLKTDITTLVTTNGQRLITGAVLNGILTDIVDSAVNRLSDASIIGLNDYSSSITYTEGKGVYYDDGGGNKLYRANKTTGPGVFVPADWDEVSGGGGAVNTIYSADDTLASNRTIDGAGVNFLQFENLTTSNILTSIAVGFSVSGAIFGASSNFTSSGGQIQLQSSDMPNNLGNTTSIQVSDLTGNGGIIVLDEQGLGLRYNNYLIDESNTNWAIDDDHIPSIGLIKANVSGGTVISGTPDRFPIFNGAGDNVEDSNFYYEETTPTDDRNHSILATGLSPNPGTTSVIFGSGITEFNQSKLEFAYLASDATGQENFAAIMQSNQDTRIEVREGGITNPALGYFKQIDLVVNGGTGFSVAHNDLTYGDEVWSIFTSDLVYSPQSGVQAYWAIRNQESFFHFGRCNRTTPDKTDSVVKITNSTIGLVDRPHLLLNGGFDEGATTPTNGAIWLSANDSKVYLRSSTSTNIAIEDIGKIISGLPTYADDAAAGVGGLTTDDVYKTATGELRIKL